jgi:hypothetical protein
VGELNWTDYVYKLEVDLDAAVRALNNARTVAGSIMDADAYKLERAEQLKNGAEAQAEHFLAQREKLLFYVGRVLEATLPLSKREGEWAPPFALWGPIRESIEELRKYVESGGAMR